MELSANEIAQKLNGSVNGDGDIKASGIKDLDNAGETDVSFVLGKKYLADAEKSPSKIILSDFIGEITGKTVIKVENTKLAYVELINIFNPPVKPVPGIADSAVVSSNAKIGKEVSIGENAVIANGCEIGDGTVIGAGVVIEPCCKIGSNSCINPNVVMYNETIVGNNTIIHSGTVIGSDGFGFVPSGTTIVKVPQIGHVEIGDHVEIGANCTIDRAAFGATVISDGVKIDNLVHVAHNVTIGPATIIAGQTGIAGSTKIGMGCLIGGQVGFADHVNIGDFVQIGSQAGISKDIPSKSVVTGTPARPLMEERKSQAYVGKLGDLFKQVKELETEIKKLKEEK